MLKALILTAFLLVSSLWVAHSQNLQVVAVKGNVKSKKINKTLRPGDIIPLDDKLTFKESSDFITLYTTEGQRKYVTYPRKRFRKKKAIYDLSLVLKDGGPSQLPIDSNFRTVEGAKKFFSERGFILFGPESKIKMNKALFPISKSFFFYVNYDFKEDNVDKKLDSRADSLIFIKRNIFKVDGKEVDSKYATNFKLYYYNQPKTKHTFLGKFKPFFPIDERLKEETDILVNMLKAKNATDETIVTELAGFFQQHYGNMISEDYKQWLKDNYPTLTYPKVPAVGSAQK